VHADDVGVVESGAMAGNARTIAISGSASGIGAALRRRLVGEGHRVVGIDLHDADIVADLGTADGRAAALDALDATCGGSLDGLVAGAGVAGVPDRSGALLTSVNYFGAVRLVAGARHLLAGHPSAAVVISSNSTTTQPGVPARLIEACLADDEDDARAVGEEVGAVAAYAATKAALARWVRRRATTADWIGQGISLNAIAPGATVTAMTDEVRADPVLGQFIDAFPIPFGRQATAEEIAGVIAFLLGPDARVLCGSVVFADGGTDAQIRPDDWPAPMA
jgi:NAD(P)-dependent dehydrogenase (short-subunit alcohol dehydrogenase family)